MGAEGIGDELWFAAVTADPEQFARAVTDVLRHPGPARERATQSRARVAAEFGRAGFTEALDALHARERIELAVGASAVSSAAIDSARAAAVPEVTVVIPAYNAAKVIGRTLAALAAQRDAPPFEVVVADNRSTDDLEAAVAPWRAAMPCGIRVVPAHGRQGVSHARNAGIDAVRSEKVLVCDADDEVAPNWVAQLSAALESAPLVGSRTVQVDAEGRTESHAPVQSAMGYLPYVLGGAMGLRREVWSAVGGFDESYPAGHEEVDFCWRAHDRGFGVLGVDGTHVRYVQRETARAVLKQFRSYAEGSLLLWTRFEHTGQLPPVSFLRTAIDALRQTVRELPLLWRAYGPGGSLRAEANLTVTDRERARRLGWLWGTVLGHLRYRKLGSPPPRQLWRNVTVD